MDIKDLWVVQMTNSMCMAFPDMDRADIRKYVIDEFDKKYRDHSAVIYNNYEQTVANTSLSSLVDWFRNQKPLICESGVYFIPKHLKRNVNTEIIKENMLDARTIHKKEMFQCLDKGDEFGAAVKNLQQANDKKAANSGYGAEAEASSFLYNLHSAMSVTSCGRGQLSTACQCVENLVSDSVSFFNMDEFFTWVNNIVGEEPDWSFDEYDVIDTVPTKKEFISRFVRKFGSPELAMEDIIGNVYKSLSDRMRIRVYYKANLREFLVNSKPMKIFWKIAKNNVEFIDPNDVPEEIKANVSLLTELVIEFVNYKHSVFRYEDRTTYQRRKTIVVMDTDSVFVFYGSILKFVMNEVLPMKLIRNKDDRRIYKLRVLNVLACFVDSGIRDTLANYTSVVNIAEEDRKYIKMKNEFYYDRLIITYAKKSYIGLQLRQEAHIFDPPKLDVKGVNFFKSTASASTSKFIYDEVLMGEILQPADGEVKLKRVIKTIQKFQDRMAGEIEAGDMGYLKRSIRVKSPDAYANPLSNGAYKAVYVWNKIMPDKDRIDLPATVTLVKVNLQKREDCAKLAKWPKIYEKMLNLFDTDPEVGGQSFEDDMVEAGKKLRGEKVPAKKAKGIKAIALPTEYDSVPDWVLSIIDTETLVGDNMKLLTQLYKPLGMVPGETRHNSNAIKYYTNVVKL